MVSEHSLGLYLGRERALNAAAETAVANALSPHQLVTHAVVLGMTGSGKTGLAMVLVEEALRSKIPVLMVDLKGDLPNLLLAFERLDTAHFAPWVDEDSALREGLTREQRAEQLATQWRNGLAQWNLGEPDAASLRQSIAPRILTPGAEITEPVHVLSALERRDPLWDTDPQAAREALSSALSLLLRLLQREADPARSREHVVLSLLAERRLSSGQHAPLEALLGDLTRPPISTVGAMSLDDFLPPKERTSLCQSLNTLLVAPTFAAWRKGAALDVGAWLKRRPDAKTPAVIVSVAHLDDDERALVLGLLFDELLRWIRTLPGTSDLRALVVFDEVHGYIPPHPANPPTKRPLLALLKQARAFGVGLVLATQNPMDVDYKALSNAGVWLVGRLQTDADRERAVEGLAGSDAGAGGLTAPELAIALKSLPKRTFFMRNVHRSPACHLLETRWCLSWLRGPMTRQELRRLQPPTPPVQAHVATNVTPVATPGAAIEPVKSQANPAAPPMPATRETPVAREPAAAPSASPSAPDGWRVWHGHADASPTARWMYKPWVAAKVAVHLRDTASGIDLQKTVIVAAPLTDDARVDITRALEIDPKFLANAPAQGARYQELPAGLSKASALRAVEKTLRDHGGRLATVSVTLHERLGMVQSLEESRDAFVQRCREAAALRIRSESEALGRKHEPKIQGLYSKAQIARQKLAELDRAAPSNLDMLGAIAVGGRRGLASASRKRDKVLDKRGTVMAAIATADAALAEAVALRDAAVTALGASLADIERALTTRTIAAKKTDVDLIEVGIAWARA